MKNLKADVVRKAAKLTGWDLILKALCPEIDSRAFDKPGRHTKCPVHGVAGRGGDGFKFFRKDFQDSGGGMCNTCGTYPDGFSLLMWVKNYGFADAVADVGNYLGIRSTEDENQQEKVNRANEQALAARRKELEEKEAASNLYHRKRLNELWKGSLPLTHPDAEPARLYLASRKILCWDREGVERVVRFHPSLSSYNEDGEFEGDFPGIVAKVTKAGLPITLHRYFLTPKGQKAPVESAKKMCMYPTDKLVTGGGIFVGAWDKEEIDVCEGLETAWAIETGTNFAVQVHSLVNATLLEGFEPGPHTKRVRIWIDKDRSGRGEEAGMNLKKRLWERGIQAQILTPSLPLLDGEKSVDWNDVLLQLGCMGFPQMRRAA